MPHVQESPDGRTPPIVVIGYGNSLRHDDGVGCRIAEAVRGWASPDVRAIAAGQLTPELAAELAAARMAIFVDARAASPPAGVRCEEIEPPDAGAPSMAHAVTPRFLMGLSVAAFGRCARSWIVSVPSRDFSLGEGLSGMANDGMQIALGVIDRLIRGSEPDFPLSCPMVDRNDPPAPNSGPRP